MPCRIRLTNALHEGGEDLLSTLAARQEQALARCEDVKRYVLDLLAIADPGRSV